MSEMVKCKDTSTKEQISSSCTFPLYSPVVIWIGNFNWLIQLWPWDMHPALWKCVLWGFICILLSVYVFKGPKGYIYKCAPYTIWTLFCGMNNVILAGDWQRRLMPSLPHLLWCILCVWSILHELKCFVFLFTQLWVTPFTADECLTVVNIAHWACPQKTLFKIVQLCLASTVLTYAFASLNITKNKRNWL